MLIALLKGKLSGEQRNMEDLLTSNVFGLLQHYQEKLALLPFIREARTLEGRQPLGDVPDETRATYEFWPLWRTETGRYCEPDVVLQLELPDDSRRLVLVEAKFHAGKSDTADVETTGEIRDQLAREWACLLTEADRRRAQPVLIYLTPHLAPPRDDIEASLAALGAIAGPAPVISWLSWRRLTTVLSATADPLLRELNASLIRLGLELFTGLPDIRPWGPVLWTFENRWDWPASTIESVTWRFT